MDNSRALVRRTGFQSVRIAYTLSVYIALVGTLMTFISYMFGISIIGTLGSYIIAVGAMPCGALALLLEFKDGVKIRSTEWAVFLTIVATVMCVFFGTEGSIGSAFSGLLLFLMFPFFAAYYPKMKYIRRVKTAIFAGNFVFCLLHIAVSFTSLAYVRRHEGQLLQQYYLALGYSNPNQTGMMMMAMFLILLVFIFKTRHKLLKLAGAAVAAYMAYLIWETDSRACILMVALAVGALAISFPKRVNKVIIFLSFLAPFVMVLMELVFSSLVEGIQILGETMATGRGAIFKELLEDLEWRGVFFGNMLQYSHLHNGFLTVFAKFGIIGTACYVLMLWRLYMQCYRNAKTAGPAEMIAFCGLLVIMIHSAVEAAFLTFGTSYASMMAFLMILTHPDENTEAGKVNELGEKE